MLTQAPVFPGYAAPMLTVVFLNTEPEFLWIDSKPLFESGRYDHYPCTGDDRDGGLVLPAHSDFASDDQLHPLTRTRRVSITSRYIMEHALSEESTIQMGPNAK